MTDASMGMQSTLRTVWTLALQKKHLIL
jgi:hypothetical protein